MAHKQTSLTPCFSGECGYCNNCNPIHNPCKEPENYSLSFAKDLSRFYKKEDLENLSEKYRVDVNKWCKKYGYLKPTDIGWAREKVNINQSWIESNDVLYELIQSVHDGLCNNITCTMTYLQCPEWTRNKFYPVMPMYRSTKDKNVKLCGICVEKCRKM